MLMKHLSSLMLLAIVIAPSLAYAVTAPAPEGVMDFRFGMKPEFFKRNSQVKQYECFKEWGFKQCFDKTGVFYGFPARLSALFRPEDNSLKTIHVDFDLRPPDSNSCSQSRSTLLELLMEKYGQPKMKRDILGPVFIWHFSDGVMISAFSGCFTENAGFLRLEYEKTNPL